MYVSLTHRGTGVSTAFLARLEGFGRASEWSRLVLEAGGRVRYPVLAA